MVTDWLRFVCGVFLWVCPSILSAQSLHLAEVQELARNNYPLIKQHDLIRQTNSLVIQNLNKNYLPQIALNGQATYQSDVTQIAIPVPGVSIDPLSKDQYKVNAELNQIVFDGGVTAARKRLQRVNTKLSDEKVEVELYQVRERVNQLFLSILLLEEQIKQVGLLKADIRTGIKKTEALLKNGLVFRSNMDVLQAELIKTEQRIVELRANRKGTIDALSLLINRPLGDDVQLDKPEFQEPGVELHRPELRMFQQQGDVLQAQKAVLVSKNLPKLSLFGQGGYGRPGLNMLQNKFDWFYLGGIRMSWNLGGMYSFQKEKQLLDISISSTNLQREAFLLNTRMELSRQRAEIEKLKRLVESDQEIISLRARVKLAANAQLENQAISASDYLREVIAEEQARQNLIIHQIQLIQANINYNTIAGN